MAERKRAQRKKRERKNVPIGHAHIQSTFNNTIVTITDTTGNVVLPVRGQRTKTNARQRRGPKKTVGIRRKK